MKILVTGGMGFIGSHIIDACVLKGDEVFSVDDMSSGKPENANSEAPNFEIDISDAEKLENVFKKVKPEIIFHCAALARIQPSFENPSRYFQVNAIGTRNILALAKKYGCRRVVYSASSSAYGSQEAHALKEDMKLAAQSLHPYGSTKRMGEMLMRDMGKITGGPETVCLRYFNVYGPRQTTTADGPYATVMGIFLDQAWRKELLTIVPDGHQRRDFTWVGDIVCANLLAASSPKVGEGEIINIGSGENHSIWEVAAIILGKNENTLPEELLKSGQCVMAPARRGEVRKTLADISLAKKLLDWRPDMKFQEGINLLKSNRNN
ncbi:MAG: NAD-dependent epimerase/dehydratase family protein [Candidatus Niyogibacteria bacterium]|nr:NAD-dependent epimerase/dehydratase family protein [Candidatus Niyogibacteria bacterium]